MVDRYLVELHGIKENKRVLTRIETEVALVMIRKNPKNNPLPARADGSSQPPKRLAPPREACTYGHFSHTKLYDYINEGRVHAYKRDKRTLIDLDSIDRMHEALPRIAPHPKPKKEKQSPSKEKATITR